MSGYNEGTGLYSSGCCGSSGANTSSFLWSNYNSTTFTDSNVNIGYSNNPYKFAVNGSIYTKDNVLSTGSAHTSHVSANSIIQNLACINGDFNKITAQGYCNLIRNELTTESNYVPSCALLTKTLADVVEQQPLWSNYEQNVFTNSNVGIGYSTPSQKLAVDGNIFAKDNILSTGSAHTNLVNANSILQNADIINLIAKFARIDSLLVNKLTMPNILDTQLFGTIKKSSEGQTVSTTVAWENQNNDTDQKYITVKIVQSLATNTSNGSLTKSIDINTYVPLSWNPSHNSGAGSFDIYKTLSIVVSQTSKSITFQSTTSIVNEAESTHTAIKSHTISLDIISVPLGLGAILIT